MLMGEDVKALAVAKPAFKRGDRTSVAIYVDDMELVKDAEDLLKRFNPGMRIASPDVMRKLVGLGLAELVRLAADRSKA